MIRIEIKSTQVDERSGTSAKGKAYNIREQKAYAHVLDEHGKPEVYPVKCSVPLQDSQPAYQPGFYQIDPRSVMVGDFMKLALGRVFLVAESAAARKVA